MVIDPNLARLRTWLDQAQLGPQERRVAEELLEKATRGDAGALRRIAQTAAERGCFSLATCDDPPLPPGPLFVCPVDPAHYRASQRDVGDDLTCPEHGVPLRKATSEG